MNLNEMFTKKDLEKFESELFIIKGHPVFKLKECLEKLDLDYMKKIYSELLKEHKNWNKLSKEEIIEILCNELPNIFMSFINFFSLNDLEEVIEAKTTTKPNVFICGLGFMFGFKDKKETVYVIPNEFKEVYKEGRKKNSIKAIEKFNFYIYIYMLINGVLKEDLIKEIIQIYNINIDEEVGFQELEKNELYKYNKNYYTAEKEGNLSKKEKDVIEELIKTKESMPYKYLTQEEIMEYNIFLNNIYDELTKIFPFETDVMPFLTSFFVYNKDAEKTINEIIQNQKLNKEKANNLKDLISDIKNDIRYWNLNGRTFEEYCDEDIMKKVILPKKPKNNSLKTCLDNLSKEGYEIINEEIEAKNSKALAEEIISNFKNEICDYTQCYYKLLKGCNNKEYNKEIDTYELINGYLFIYQEKDKIKTFIPEEIQEVLDKIDINDLEECDCDCDCIDF